MSLLSRKKAEEIIDLCLAEESPEHKSRVLEILAMSEIEPNDPLFLALLATGNLRVFFEQGLIELKKTVREVEVVREQTKDDLMKANSLLLEQIKAERKEFLLAITNSNSEFNNEVRESLNELKASKSEIIKLNSLICRERTEHIRIMKTLIDGLAKTTSELELASSRIEGTIKYRRQLFSLKNILKHLNKWKLFFGGVFFISLSIAGYLSSSKNYEDENIKSSVNLKQKHNTIYYFK